MHLMDRAYGKTVQVTQENVTENRKQVLEVRWLSPDLNDRSKLIEPEPDLDAGGSPLLVLRAGLVPT